MDKLKKSDLESQKASLEAQIAEYKAKTSECLGALQLVDHMLKNFEWSADGGSTPTV